jgi:hypothetical protein
MAGYAGYTMHIGEVRGVEVKLEVLRCDEHKLEGPSLSRIINRSRLRVAVYNLKWDEKLRVSDFVDRSSQVGLEVCEVCRVMRLDALYALLLVLGRLKVIDGQD